MVNLDDSIWKHINNYPDYYVNRLGDVFSMRKSGNGHYLSKKIMNRKNYVLLFKSFTGAEDSSWLPVDRLVATAFVDNPKPDEFKYVIHLDGNLKNDNSSNLKWGVNNNANGQGTPIRAINVKTNKILDFDTQKTASEYFGCDKSFITTHINKYPKRLYKGEWRFEYINPSIVSDMKRMRNSIPVMALNMQTNELVKSLSCSELARVINVNANTIREVRDTCKLAKGVWLIESMKDADYITTEHKKEENNMSYIPAPKKENTNVPKFAGGLDAAANMIDQISRTSTLEKAKPAIDPDYICGKMIEGIQNLPPQDTDPVALNGWLIGYSDCMKLVVETLKEVKNG